MTTIKRWRRKWIHRYSCIVFCGLGFIPRIIFISPIHYQRLVTLLISHVSYSEAMDELETLLITNQIGVDELRQRFGRQVASLYSLEIKYAKNILSPTAEDSMINVVLDRVSHIGSYGAFSSQICYRMRFDLYPFTTANEIIIITVSVLQSVWWCSVRVV